MAHSDFAEYRSKQPPQHLIADGQQSHVIDFSLDSFLPEPYNGGSSNNPQLYYGGPPGSTKASC